MEYLSNALPMNCVTYSKERMAKAVEGIQQIHLALVEHNDPYPKNIQIVPGDSERVMWIDFDVAITYPDRTYIGDRERGWLEIETRRVESVGVKLVSTSEILLFISLPLTNSIGGRSETGPPAEHKILLGWRFVNARIRTYKKKQREDQMGERKATKELRNLEPFL